MSSIISCKAGRAEVDLSRLRKSGFLTSTLDEFFRPPRHESSFQRPFDPFGRVGRQLISIFSIIDRRTEVAGRQGREAPCVASMGEPTKYSVGIARYSDNILTLSIHFLRTKLLSLFIFAYQSFLEIQ